MSIKNITIAAAVAVGLLLALTLSSSAQFRPCVWPNTCVQ